MKINSLLKPLLLVHGGADAIPCSRIQPKCEGIKMTATEGYRVLCETGNLLDAIEAAIGVMDDNELFNSGRGSVLNLAGCVEMDALITEGKNLKQGSVASARNIAHPISLARMVMEKTPHTMLGGQGLEEFIVKMCVPRVPNDYLITEFAKQELEEFINSSCKPTSSGGTVGCVAIDADGNVASGTSTGGLTGKYVGRIGDSPLSGCGGYSDNNVGAVSCTGHGESIIRFNLARRILTFMEQGESAQNATMQAIEGMKCRLGPQAEAGAIAVSNKGEVGVFFTSKLMPWAYKVNNELHYGIEPGQHDIQQ